MAHRANPALARAKRPETRRAREGVVEAGEAEVVAAARETVTRIVQHRGYYIPPDERADVVQDAMLDILRAIRSSRFENRDFPGFVRTITYRRCVDWIRQRRRRSQRLDPGVVDSWQPRDRLLEKERNELATEVLSQLREPCRDLFALHAGAGMSYGQIAEYFGRSEGALRTQAHECLKQARKMLDLLRRRRARLAGGARAWARVGG